MYLRYATLLICVTLLAVRTDSGSVVRVRAGVILPNTEAECATKVITESDDNTAAVRSDFGRVMRVRANVIVPNTEAECTTKAITESDDNTAAVRSGFGSQPLSKPGAH